MATNLPPKQSTDSAEATKLFFDSYGQTPLQFPSNDVDATVSFFLKRGFEREAANVTALSLLKQAKIDGINIFSILDTLETFNAVQISALVAEILNNNRVPTSTLGYRSEIPANFRTREFTP